MAWLEESHRLLRNQTDFANAQPPQVWRLRFKNIFARNFNAASKANARGYGSGYSVVSAITDLPKPDSLTKTRVSP